jgi:hypothetical protein
MKRFIVALAAFAAAVSPTLAVRAQGDTSMGMASVGAGPNGYDYMAGTWSCSNTMSDRSALGALQSTTFSATKLKDGSIEIHTMSPNGDVTSYNAYLPKTKTWYSPFADSGGYFGYESTQQSGKTIRWVGTFYAPSGAATPIRDTYTMLSMTKQYDLSEAKVNGAWKATAKTTCTKS